MYSVELSAIEKTVTGFKFQVPGNSKHVFSLKPVT
jgi:hypothetical protein